MNRKRKILTVVALAVFGAIILSHYSKMGWHWVPSGRAEDGTGTSHWRAEWVISPSFSMLPDVRMPLFVLAVFYAGLFALLGDSKRKEQ